MADLFCGAGGTSTGAIEALGALGHEVALTAINHWDVAVATHQANHPGARHLCASLDALNPRDLYRPGELQLLWASPECTHHSIARGGKPINDQSRATAWCVVRWAEALLPPTILIENVPEFKTWGPIGARGRPLKSRKGETFRAWVAALASLGYQVDWRVLVAADYGDPTTRRRLFVQAVRGRRQICWPDATHAQDGRSGLAQWVPAADIIDWDLPGQSIFDRKRPLSEKTLRRIEAGLRKFGLAPSVVAMEHGGRTDSIDLPLRTITTARGGAMALAHPFLVQVAHDGSDASRSRSTSSPLPAVAGNRGDWSLCEPALLPQQSDGRLRPVTEPSPTVAASGAIGLVEPFLVKFYGTGGAASIRNPVDTVTSRDRFGLARPVVELNGDRYWLDVRFRMLQPHELAGAQGFRRDYRFSGNKTQVVRQIGNAVPRNQARALVAASVGQSSDVSALMRAA
jgi:DNA (cytosine-5)-methyltransferase 1